MGSNERSLKATLIPRRIKKLAIRLSNNFIFINPEEITFITRKERKTVIYTTNGTYAITESLENLEQRLDSETFFRCHKGFIVNVELVKEFSHWGNKTYLVKLMNTEETALATMEKAKEFRQKYCLE